jgi:hypothetical protein
MHRLLNVCVAELDALILSPPDNWGTSKSVLLPRGVAFKKERRGERTKRENQSKDAGLLAMAELYGR